MANDRWFPVPLSNLDAASMRDYDSLDQKVLLCALLTLAACCFTMTLDPVMAEVAYVVTAKSRKNPEAYNGAGNKAYAQAFGLFNTAYSLGNTLGPIIAGLIKDAAGWSTMGWVLGLLDRSSGSVMVWEAYSREQAIDRAVFNQNFFSFNLIDVALDKFATTNCLDLTLRY